MIYSKIKIITYTEAPSKTTGDIWYSALIVLENGASGTISSLQALPSFAAGDSVQYSGVEKNKARKMSFLDFGHVIDNTGVSEEGAPEEYVPLVAALRSLDYKNCVFFDIETVTANPELDPDSDEYAAWEYVRRKDEEFEQDQLLESYKNKAPLFAEFGKIVCFSFGKPDKKGNINTDLVLYSVYGDDEKKLIQDACDILNKLPKTTKLCGHSIKGFDIPYFAKKCMQYGLPVPALMDTSNKKPWELLDILDIKDIWQGTSFYTTALVSICLAMGVKSPKDGELTGKDVSKAFYDGKIVEIVKYCEEDVLAVADIVKKLLGRPVNKNVTSNTIFNEPSKQ